MFSLAVLFLFGCSPPSNSSEYDLRIVGISASLGLAEAETIQQLDYEIYIKNYSSEPVEIKSMKPTMPIFLQERLVENNLKQELNLTLHSNEEVTLMNTVLITAQGLTKAILDTYEFFPGVQVHLQRGDTILVENNQFNPLNEN